MVERSSAQERREFFRLNFSSPIRYKTYSTRVPNNSAELVSKGTSQNISPSGILFQIKDTPPELSSILWLSLDIRTLKICQEIESRALIFNNGLLGKVVRVEEDTKNSKAYDVGVCFLTKAQKDSREVKQILSTLSSGA